jgi:hypothetical protein
LEDFFILILYRIEKKNRVRRKKTGNERKKRKHKEKTETGKKETRSPEEKGNMKKKRKQEKNPEVRKKKRKQETKVAHDPGDARLRTGGRKKPPTTTDCKIVA